MTEVNIDAIQSFQKMFGSNELMLKAFDGFPIPVEIFAADGTMVFLNRVLLEIYGIPDAGSAIGKYNLLHDPVCNDVMGLRDDIQKAFRGEGVFIKEALQGL